MASCRMRIEDLIWVLTGLAAVKGSEGRCSRGLQLRLVDRYLAVGIGKFCGKAPRALSEYDEVRQGIPAWPIRAMQSCRRLPAAKSPGTFDICESPSTRIPPIM